MLELVEKERKNISKEYKKLHGKPLNDNVKYDPFAMLSLYCTQMKNT